jgi:hypothetical protein
MLLDYFCERDGRFFFLISDDFLKVHLLILKVIWSYNESEFFGVFGNSEPKYWTNRLDWLWKNSDLIAIIQLPFCKHFTSKRSSSWRVESELSPCKHVQYFGHRSSQYPSRWSTTKSTVPESEHLILNPLRSFTQNIQFFIIFWQIYRNYYDNQTWHWKRKSSSLLLLLYKCNNFDRFCWVSDHSDSQIWFHLWYLSRICDWLCFTEWKCFRFSSIDQQERQQLLFGLSHDSWVVNTAPIKSGDSISIPQCGFATKWDHS